MTKLNLTKDILIQDYNELKCLTKISIKYGVHRQTIANLFKKLNIEYKSKIHKYSSNEEYFNNDNQDVFYWAGFIAADGCMYQNKAGLQQLVIKLAEQDLSHLILFKHYIETQAPISLYINKNSLRNKKWNDTKQYQLRITSKKIYESLKRFNIVSRKTKIYDFPDWLIEHPLVHHFMRGYFDGDGCISNSTNWYLSIRGNKNFLKKYKLIIEKQGNLESKVNITINNGTHQLMFGGRYIINVITNYLYKDSTLCLQRKYEKHIMLCQENNNEN